MILIIIIIIRENAGGMVQQMKYKDKKFDCGPDVHGH